LPRPGSPSGRLLRRISRAAIVMGIPYIENTDGNLRQVTYQQ
jgi:hypothetical protein